MCLVLVAWQQHPEYRLVLAANREEYYGRPTASAGFWDNDPSILGGRDLVHGGTWLGVDRNGRFAAVTNIREPAQKSADSLSRGLLVSRYLQAEDPPMEYLVNVSTRRSDFDPFNLLIGDDVSLAFLCSLDGAPVSLPAGIYGISNGRLDCPWPKVRAGKVVLHEMIKSGGTVKPELLFAMLSDTRQANDNELPDTGIGIDLERKLSAFFVTTGFYGTRSSTVLTITQSGKVEFKEKNYSAGGLFTGERDYSL